MHGPSHLLCKILNNSDAYCINFTHRECVFCIKCSTQMSDFLTGRKNTNKVNLTFFMNGEL